MQFDISSSDALVGKTRLPGDLNLTLSVMALGMLSPEPIKVHNPSPSPVVTEFRKFLKDNGAVFHDTCDGFCLKGKPWEGDLIIGPEVPDSVVHLIVGSASFLARSVRIINGVREKESLIRHLQDILKNVGLTPECVGADGEDILIRQAEFISDDMISVSSAWTFEAICAAALAVRMPLTLSYPPQTVSHSLKLLTLLGYHSTMPDNMSVMDTEIARRLAKVSGSAPLKIQRLEWTHSVKQTIDIPGDTTLAAAIAGAGSIVPGSDVTLKDVLWEQGRRGFFEALHRMKGMIKHEQTYKKNSFDSAHITVRWSNLEGIHVTSDQALTFMTELLILGAVAASANGETVISDGKEGLKHGRSGFSTLAKGLTMLGSYVGDFSDGIVINGGHEMRGDLVDSGGRADIALALAVTGMNAAGTTTVFGFDGNAYPVREFIRIVKKFTSQTVLPDQ